MKLLLIAKNNIKRSKGTSIILLLLVFCSVVMMYIGLNVLTEISHFVESKDKELNSGSYICTVQEKDANKAAESIKSMATTIEVEDAKIIKSMTTEIQNKTLNDAKQTMPSALCPYDESRKIGKIKLVGDHHAAGTDEIYVPYIMKVNNGYSLDQTINLKIMGKDFDYKIAGFFEDIVFCNPSSSGEYQFYLSQEGLALMRDRLDESKQFHMFHIITKEGTDIKQYEREVTKSFYKKAGINTFFEGMQVEEYKQGSGIFVNILMVIILAFAIVLVVISLIIIRFSINVEIERNMTNIGSLQAMGYTSGQVRKSIIIQFCLIGIIGGICGIIAALFLSNLTGEAVSVAVGLVWKNRISFIAIVVSLLVVLGLILLVASIVARKLNRITPLIALRSGIETHNFKKNHLPLEHGRGNVNMEVGIKGMLHNMKQNAAIIVIISLLSFAGVFVMTMYYNFNVEEQGMLNLVGIESADVQVIADKENYKNVKEEISKKEEVEKCVDYANEYMTVDAGKGEENTLGAICKDYSKLSLNKLIKGSYATQDNEVVVTKLLAKKLGVEIGDSITVSLGQSKKEFVIVGLIQQMSNLGNSIQLTEQGVKRILPDYELVHFYVYLKDNVKTADFMDQINKQYADSSVSFYNNEEMLSTSLGSFQGSISLLCIVFIIITCFVIVLTLLLLIRLKIVKEKKEFGIFKAIGYTTKQLIVQTLFGFLPIIILGCLIGLIMGGLLSNPFMGVMLQGVGIFTAKFKISALYSIIIPALILLISIMTIFLISVRIRKITPNELFYE